ncbi:MAG: hypothetical protein AAGJ46_12385 [Planctomycetota bacterium]
MPTTPDTLVLPQWFRVWLIALVTISLCSCRAPDPTGMADRLAEFGLQPTDDVAGQQTELRVVEEDGSKVGSPGVSPGVHQTAGTNADKTVKTAAAEVASPSDMPAPRVASMPVVETVVEPVIVPAIEPPCPAGCPVSTDCESRQLEATPLDTGASCPIGGCNGGGCQGGSCPVGAPCGPACCSPYTGPGPRDEYLCDGGDCGPPVGVEEDFRIDGLGPEDTIAHYDTIDGRVLIEPSNKVCIYAPRFAAVRRVVWAGESTQRNLINVLEDDMLLSVADRAQPPATSLQQLPLVTKIGERPPSLLINRQQPGELETRVVVEELRNLIKPYCNLQVVKLGLVDNAEKPWLAKANVAALTWIGDQAAQVTISGQAASVKVGAVAPGEIYTGQDGEPCLRLIKLASADHAKPGDEVEFTLRFDNVGQQEIGNVTVVDHLVKRLAYVPESAKSSVDANFSTSRDGEGSLVLRWEITKPLKPGEGGVLQFRVRVR